MSDFAATDPTWFSPESEPNTSRTSLFAVGELLSETFEIRELLGEGGMGQVFEAHDHALKRRVAIKAIWPRTTAGMLRMEAQALAAIRHSSMVTVHSLGSHRGVDYMVMERVYGISLEAHIAHRRAAGRRFSIDETIELIVPITEGIAAVHCAGIAHRDIKPANIMLAPGGRVVLMDLGLFLPENAVSGRASVAGSPQYMAPETIASKVAPGEAHLVDLYALGVVAYELLVGRAPFVGKTVEDIWGQHLASPLPDPSEARPDIPPRLRTLLSELLAKAPLDRPRSAEAVLWQLHALRNERATERPAKVDERYSVLVVDDEPEIVKVLTFYVKKALGDVDVRTASNGEQAIEALRERLPNIMLLDLHMPRMNGIEVCMYVSGTGLTEGCTIVAVSAGAQEHDVALLSSLGIRYVINKGDALRDKLVEALRTIHGRVEAE